MKIYVASSWRNKTQPSVVNALRHEGYDVFDFRHPSAGDFGFHWSDIDSDWQEWSMEDFRNGLEHPTAKSSFKKDFDAMANADACVLVMPCGRSAHLEAGYFIGAKKSFYILLADGEPELMYSMATKLCLNIGELITSLAIEHSAWMHEKCSAGYRPAGE